MPKVISVAALKNYRIRLQFEDRVEGEADLSHLAGKGVFAAWKDDRVWNSVGVGLSGEVRWGNQIDLCPDALYLKVTGKKPEDLFDELRNSPARA